MFARKQNNFAVLGFDEDRYLVQGGIGDVNSVPVGMLLGKENTSRKWFRKRTEIQKKDDDEVVNHEEDERVERSWIYEDESDDVDDEQYLFEGLRVTEAKHRNFGHKKEKNELVKYKSAEAEIHKSTKCQNPMIRTGI